MLEGKYAVIMATCGGKEEARKIARTLVEERLAACVQMFPITSCYEWEGKMNEDEEILLFIKTRTARYEDVEAAIRDHHSYDVPEIIRVPIEGGLQDYLKFLDDMTQ